MALWAADAVTSLVVLQPGASPDGISLSRFAASLSIHPAGRCVAAGPGMSSLLEAPCRMDCRLRVLQNLKHLIHDAIRSRFADADSNMRTSCCADPSARTNRESEPMIGRYPPT